MVIRAKRPTLACLLAGGLFAPASLITLILPSISREAELLHELKVLGNSVSLEVLQRAKECVRKREILERVAITQTPEQHCSSVNHLPLIDLNMPI